jgi:hypothetical protein
MLDVPSPPVAEAMQLVALDEEGEEHRGSILPQDEGPEDPPPFDPPPVDPALLVGMQVAAFFNPELFATCRPPRRLGRFEVWVEFRGHRSNSVRIEVIKSDG